MRAIPPKFYSPEIRFTLKRIPFDYDEWDKNRQLWDRSKQIRPIFGKKYNKKGFVLFGCSYAFGAKLKDSQTFAYKLSQLTKRPVYTLAVSGTSLQFSIMDVQGNKYNDYIKNSDYAIYIPISEHLWRIVTHCGGQFTSDIVWPRYDNNNGKLVFHKCKYPFIEGSYIYRSVQKSILVNLLVKKNNYVFNKMFDLYKMHIELLNSELKKRNPNIKLVILVYRDGGPSYFPEFITTKRWKEIEDMGITVISAEDLGRRADIRFNRIPKYSIPNDGHPSEAAWNLITPLFVKKLNIK